MLLQANIAFSFFYLGQHNDILICARILTGDEEDLERMEVDNTSWGFDTGGRNLVKAIQLNYFACFC